MSSIGKTGATPRPVTNLKQGDPKRGLPALFDRVLEGRPEGLVVTPLDVEHDPSPIASPRHPSEPGPHADVRGTGAGVEQSSPPERRAAPRASS